MAQHIITAGWLYNDGSLHRALDFRAAVGTPIYAAEAGTVAIAYHWNGKRTSGDTNSYGNMLKLRHATYKYGTLETLYAHLSKLCVAQGETVYEGQLIGYSGDTGNCYGAHLHFEVRWRGNRTNPLNCLDNDFSTASSAVKLGSYSSIKHNTKEVKRMYYAIDVSKHQGSIDWPKVAASGVRFAILRAGYGNTAAQADPYFAANYTAARAAGLKVGAYWYSYAKDPDDAASEAAACLQVLAGRKLDLPLFFDQEYEPAILAQTTAGRTVCVQRFCAAVQAAGYRPGLYASKNWLESRLDMAQLGALPVWVAQYAAACTYGGPYVLWQNSSSGSVPGISGPVDTNICPDEALLFGSEKEETMSDLLKVGPVSGGDRKTLAALADSLGLPHEDAGDYLIIGPASAGDRKAIAAKAAALAVGCVEYTAPEPKPEPEPEPAPEPTPTPDDSKSDATACTEQLGRIEAKLDKLLGLVNPALLEG